MKLETDRGHFFVDGVRRTDITQEEFDDMVRLEKPLIMLANNIETELLVPTKGSWLNRARTDR